MNVSEIRRQNLILLIDKEFNGNLSQFTKKINQDYCRYNYILNGKIKVTNKAVRLVESALELESGMLDLADGMESQQKFARAIKINKYPTLVFNKDTTFKSSGIGNVFVAKSVLTELKVDEHKLVAFRADDNSMSPTINVNAQIIVDTDDKIIVNNKLYVVAIGSQLFIRRLEQKIGSNEVLLKPDGKRFGINTVDVNDDKFYIVGRVILQLSFLIDS